jgi:hypothetical protein
MNLIESIERYAEEKELLAEGLETQASIDAVKAIGSAIGFLSSFVQNTADKDKSGSAKFARTSLREIDKNINIVRKNFSALFSSELTLSPTAKKVLVDIADTLNRQPEKINNGSKGTPSLISLIEDTNKEEEAEVEELPDEDHADHEDVDTGFEED